jgi:hypothetical protein
VSPSILSTQVSDVLWAADMARELLRADMPRRWKHVQGVARRAAGTQGLCAQEWRERLVAAAWVHDIGYAPPLVETGFHPIDGARYLRREGVDEDIVGLVAHHTCARVEAQLRGLDDILRDEFPRDDTLPHAELCFCDMVTSPDGELVDVADRLAEIRERYGPEHVVYRFVEEAGGELLSTVRAVEARVAAQPR